MAYEDRSYSGVAVITTLTSNITPTSTNLPIADATGWPDGSSGPFHVAIAPASDPESFSEVIRCSGRTDLLVHVQSTPVTGRGWDGTTAAAHLIGSIIAHVFTATDADEANQHIVNTGLDHHTQYLTVTRHDSPTRHGISSLPVGGTPTTSAVGDTAQVGTSTSLPRSDHKHAREEFGTPVRTGNAISPGVSTALARADHVHTDTPVICTSTTRPTGYNGLTIIEEDTRRILYFNGGNWIRIGWTWSSGRTGATLTRSSYEIPAGGANPTYIPWSGEAFDSDNFITPNGATSVNFTLTDALHAGLWMVSVVGAWGTRFVERAFIEVKHGTNQYRFNTTGEDRIAATCLLTIDPLDVAEIQIGVYQASPAVQSVTLTAEIYRIGL